MKQIIAIFLASLFFLQPFTKAWIFVSFKINQAHIAETLCVRKDVPENICHGDCQLMKRLKKVDQAEHQQKPSTLKMKAEILFYHWPADLQLQTIVTDHKKTLNIYNHRRHRLTLVGDFFHPPKNQHVFSA